MFADVFVVLFYMTISQQAAQSKGSVFCGSTALTAYIRDSTAYVCTVGDSRCVLCRGECRMRCHKPQLRQECVSKPYLMVLLFVSTAGKAKELSTVLTPGTPSERERIEAAGGWITEEKELVLARLHHMKLEDPLAQEKLKEQNYLTCVALLLLH